MKKTAILLTLVVILLMLLLIFLKASLLLWSLWLMWSFNTFIFMFMCGTNPQKLKK